MQITEALSSYPLQREADGRSQHTIKQAKRHVGLLALGDIRRNRRALSDEEIERFLEAARADDRDHGEMRAAVKTIESGTKSFAWGEKPRIPRVPQAPMWRRFLETGARYGEMTRSTWGDFGLEKRTLTLRGVHTKSGRTRVIPILAGLANELAALQAVEREVLGRTLSHADWLILTRPGAPWPVAWENALRTLPVCSSVQGSNATLRRGPSSTSTRCGTRSRADSRARESARCTFRS